MHLKLVKTNSKRFIYHTENIGVQSGTSYIVVCQHGLLLSIKHYKVWTL